MKVESDELLAVALRAAQAGAAQLLAWRGKFQAREKGPRDLVTDADLASEAAIRAVILAAFPDHGFLAEESAAQSSGAWDRPYCWVVDPLDGTANYAHGVPCYAVSIAATSQGRLLAGVILDPERDECFAAAQGVPTTHNGRAVKVSRTTRLAEAMVAASLPAGVRGDSPDLQQFQRVAPLCQSIRRTGSAALNLAYVACGRFDAHWAREIHPWDSAAGVLLVEQAGGLATACDGGPYAVRQGNYLTAATAELHAELLGFTR